MGHAILPSEFKADDGRLLAQIELPSGTNGRVQEQLDRMHNLSNGGFRVHRNHMEIEDEIETDNTKPALSVG